MPAVSNSMENTYLPPGFRFHPTDVELLNYYLKRKVIGAPSHFQVISDLDLYKYSPWDLPGRSQYQSSDNEWYFFCPRNKKHANGSKINRANEFGYWKVSGRDRTISHGEQNLGLKKILVFYTGRPPRGARTSWVMHEYRLLDKDLDINIQDLYVLCRVIYKSGVQSGTPLNQENWDSCQDDMLNNAAFESPQLPDQPPSQHVMADDDQNMSMVMKSMPIDTNVFSSSIEAFPILTESSGEFTFSLEGDNNLTKVEETTWPVDNNNKNEYQDLFNFNQSEYEAPPSWDGCDIFKDLEDLGFLAELNKINGHYICNSQAANCVADQMLLEQNEFLRAAKESEINPNRGFGVHYSERLYDPILDIPMPQSIDGEPMILQEPHWSHETLDMSSKLNNNFDVTKINEDEVLSYNPATAPWELHKEYESFSVTESGTQSAIYSSLQSLLESIPASHASAVENPVHNSGWSLGVQSFDKLLQINGSSKHPSPTHNYQMLNQPWKRASPGKGYKFVAGLVVLSGTSWFVLVLVVAKIARLLWKMIFS